MVCRLLTVVEFVVAEHRFYALHKGRLRAATRASPHTVMKAQLSQYTDHMPKKERAGANFLVRPASS